MDKTIAVINGDGIGPEIMTQAIRVLDKVGTTFNHRFKYMQYLLGGAAIDYSGVPLPYETIKGCKESDGVLLAAIGGYKWDELSGNLRPEAGLLGLRKELELFANIRPAKALEALKDVYPLKNEIIDKGIDLVIVRELTGGAYFGKHSSSKDENNVVTAHDDIKYSDYEIERIANVAFQMARKRRKKVCLVDKANVLYTSKLWRQVVHNVAKNYNDVELTDMFVDNCSMQLVKNPYKFDVILTENLFGDILSDEASGLTGSLGMAPSASFGEGTFGLFEPVHGSAPDIAGQNKANPLAMILSVAMMLRYSFNMVNEAQSVENAVNLVLNYGYRTADIMSENYKEVSCSTMGYLVSELIFNK